MPHSSHIGNVSASAKVSYARPDSATSVLHIGNVGKYEDSGWYLAEWREYREMTQEALAAAVNTNKGQISGLESGGKRWNRDWLYKLSAVLECEPAELVGVNPFEMRPVWAIWSEVPQENRPLAARALEVFVRKRAG